MVDDPADDTRSSHDFGIGHAPLNGVSARSYDNEGKACNMHATAARH